MNSKIFEDACKSIDPSIKKYVHRNLEIANRIFVLMDKNGIDINNLSHQLKIDGWDEYELRSILSGTHSITLKMIAKLELLFGEDIITIKNK